MPVQIQNECYTKMLCKINNSSLLMLRWVSIRHTKLFNVTAAWRILSLWMEDMTSKYTR